MSIIPVTVPSKKLSQTISATATSFKLNNIVGWGDIDLVPGDFGTESFAVFTNSTRTQIEIFKIDPGTIADPSITIIARGLNYSGGGTPDLARQFAWPSNDTTVQLGTDAPQLFRDFLSETNTATITAVHTYDTLPESAVVPTTDDQFTNKAYVDGLTAPNITIPINQVAHGFVAGDVIRISGVDTYAKAQADSPANAEVVGIVIEAVDADNFKYVVEGVVTDGVPIATAGSVLFLSRTTPGGLVTTDTTTIGEVSFPLAVVTQSSIKMIFHKYRPMVINTISGNPIASETVAGMVEKATPAQVAAQTDVGETGAPLFVVPSLIPAGSAVAAGVEPGGTTTQVINHDLGAIPKIIRLAGMSGANGSFPGCHSIGSWDAIGNRCVYVEGKSTARNAQNSTVFSVRLAENISGAESGIATGIVGNVTATTFDIVWTGSNVSEDFYWEAQT